MVNSGNKLLKYNRQIDGLRAVAILGVLIGHFVPFENIYVIRFPKGHGVILFFLISGYLITNILLKSREKVESNNSSFKQVLKAFYIKRSLRIFPIYYLLLAFLLIINFQNVKEVWVWIAAYGVNIYSSLNYPYIGSFYHFWSLAVEEQFYLIWPAVILFLRRTFILPLIISLIFFSLLFKVYLFLEYGVDAITAINALVFSYADALCLGALLAYLNLYKSNLLTEINKLKYVVLLSFIPFVVVCIYPLAHPDFVLITSNFLFACFSFFMLARAVQQKYVSIAKRFLENNLIIHIGKISYGLYLYHYFMTDLYNQLKVWVPFLETNEDMLKIPFQFIVSFIIAQLSWMLIEKPILKYKDKFNY